MKKCLVVFLTAILLSFLTITASAQVDGEHSFWKKYITKCVGTESTLSFTQQEARAASQDLTYFGSEYIRFSFGSYQNGSILITGMDKGTLICDNWDSLDDNKLSNTVLKFVLNWGENEFEKYIDDAAILIEFNDGYSLMHWKGVYSEEWTLLDKNSDPVKKEIKDEDLFDIIQQHTEK